MKRNKQSILMTGVPLSRGNPAHFEHNDDTAFTKHGDHDRVAEVHTPGDSLRRIHELMHARHSLYSVNRRIYAGMHDPVRQLTEDCRIHLNHWPWQRDHTPEPIADDARAFTDAEIARVTANAKKAGPEKSAWPLFAIKLRAACVREGLGATFDPGFRGGKLRLAAQVWQLLRQNTPESVRAAGLLIQTAFFDPPEPEPREPRDEPGDGDEPADGRGGSSAESLNMEVIELPHTEATHAFEIGTRIATSGSRIFRPALRRPVLPSRMFIRRAPVEPAGTILIDASGSMGDFRFVAETCRASPLATVAYYAGNGHNGGWLYVYARGGFRATEVVEPPARDNTIDGPAMDWLLAQDAPRVMVTDREFCDVADSDAQIVRLERLEAAGLITVQEYDPG